MFNLVFSAAKASSFLGSAFISAHRPVFSFRSEVSMTSRSFPLLIALGCTTFIAVAFAQTSTPTQASCTFNFYQLRSSFFVAGINDFGTLVGSRTLGSSAAGAIRWANGGVTLVSGTSELSARNDAGISIGLSQSGGPILLNGTSVTPISLTIGGIAYTSFNPSGINKWGTIVGTYKDSAGVTHGFKRWSNGNGVTVDYPGAKATDPLSINDSGAIVGFYSHFSPPTQSHGFIYHNGQWATLDYPNTPQYTSLIGISNAGVIFGDTFDPFFQSPTTAFLYENGVFKVISAPNYGYVVTNAISLRRGLISGAGVASDGTSNPFIAKCN
jgi:hypothetical protein